MWKNEARNCAEVFGAAGRASSFGFGSGYPLQVRQEACARLFTVSSSNRHRAFRFYPAAIGQQIIFQQEIREHQLPKTFAVQFIMARNVASLE